MKLGYQEGKSVFNNVHSLLDKHLQDRPHAPLFHWADQTEMKRWVQDPSTDLKHQTMTVTQLYHLVDHAAAGLRKIGIQEGDRVIVFIPMSVPMYVAMFAVQKIGAIPVFLDSWARRDQLGVSAEIVSPRAMISVEKAFQYLAEVKQIREIPIRIVAGPATDTYTDTLERLMQTPESSAVVPVEREQTALITFTTGSSGKPKGANRTHRFLFAQHNALNPGLPYQASDVDLPVFPIFSLNNLAAGVSTVIPAFDIGVPGEHDISLLLAQFAACKVTCTTLSPSLFNRLATEAANRNLLLPLRRIVTGGAPVSRDNIVAMQKVAPKAEILVLFGSTEAEPMAHIEGHEMVQLESRAMQDPDWVDEGVNVGRLVDSLDYKLLKIEKDPITIRDASDWQKLEVDPGMPGELIVAGEHVCQGYYNDDEAFARAKIRDLDGRVWHRTGDLGRVDDKGFLWIVGRVHNAVQRAGEYVFPVRAEMVLKKLPFAAKVAFLGVADSQLGEKTVAAVAPRETTVTEQQKNDYVTEATRLLNYNQIPVDQVVIVEDIPMDPRHQSKVEYAILRKKLLEEKRV